MYAFGFRVLQALLFDLQLMPLHHAQALEKGKRRREIFREIENFPKACFIIDNIDSFFK